jgi:osmotically-inducible protein OsmY
MRKNDTTIAVTVENALSTYNCSGKHRITARVLDGIVTLQGTVCSDELRKTIANAVRDLPGVEGFRNYISICPVAPSI